MSLRHILPLSEKNKELILFANPKTHEAHTKALDIGRLCREALEDMMRGGGPSPLERLRALEVCVMEKAETVNLIEALGADLAKLFNSNSCRPEVLREGRGILRCIGGT